MKSAQAAAKDAPWWWFEVGTEVCSTCNQSYAYQMGFYCLDCDSNICPLCVHGSENNDPLCAGCCEQ